MTYAVELTQQPSSGSGSGPVQVQAWLEQVIAPHGTILTSKAVNWQSATFQGFRLAVTLRWAGTDGCCDGEAFIEELGEAEVSLPKLLLADAAVLWTERVPRAPELTATIELLVLEETD